MPNDWLNKIQQAISQPTTYNWSAYTSQKPNTLSTPQEQKPNPSNPTGSTSTPEPRYSAASIADDFWRKSQESDANYYESQGYTFDGTNWVSPNEQMLQRTAQDVRNIPVNNSWFKGNRTYWENQAKNAYNQLNSDQRSLIDKDGNGSFSLEEIRDYQRANGLTADGKLGNNTMARLNTPSEEKTYDAGQLREVVISPKNFSRSSKQSYWVPFKKQTKPKFTQNDRDRVNQEQTDLLKNPRFRRSNAGSHPAYINGQYMPVVVTQGSLGGSHNDRSFAYDSRSKHFIPLVEDFTGYANGTPMLATDGRAFYYSQDDVLNNRMIKGHSYKNGGSLNKYQQGGSMNNREEIQRAFMAFLIEDASTQGITIQSEEDLVKYTEALGEEGIKAKYQEFIKKMQGGIKAKYGAKLTQVRKLKGLCADDEELVYLKQGGRVCPVCQKKMKKNRNGDKLEKELSEIEKFKKQYKKDAKHPDEATKDSLLINKYNDIDHLEKVEHKGSYVKGKWVPNRKNYSNKK